MRLRNQRELIHRDVVAGRNFACGVGTTVVFVPACSETSCPSSCADVCWSSGRSHLYESMTNAVRTAEKRPAYSTYSQRKPCESQYATYENQERVDVIVEVFHHTLVVLLQVLLDRAPSGSWSGRTVLYALNIRVSLK